MERIRKVDVSKMSDEDLKNAEDLISKKLTEICNNAISQANQLLSIYGLEAKLAIEVNKAKTESLCAKESTSS